MDLKTYQRALLGLLRSRDDVRPDDDAHVQRVAESRDLAEARRNVFLWRIYVLERTAALTFRLLKQRHLLGDAVRAFITEQNISPFRETQAPAFLATLTDHPDFLVAAVARFELALLKVREGDPRPYIIEWKVDPYPILNRLARDLPLDAAAPEERYEVHVARDLPHQFAIMAVAREDEDHAVARPTGRV